MPRYRLLSSVVAASLSIVLLFVSNAAAQEPSQSSAQDPFQAAEKAAEKGETRKAAGKAEPKSEFVRKTDAEWSRLLPRPVYMVTRQKATEPPFSGKYATGHFQGTFHCACCDAPLFSSKAKFDSGTGWPSFFQPVTPKAIDRAPDYAESEPRIEVMCHRCGAHLGHVFDDAPATPTGLRFCINSLSLKLEKNGAGEGSTKTASNSRSRAKSRVSSARSRSRGTLSSSRTRAAKAAGSDAADETAPAADTAPAPAGKKTGGD